MPKFNPPLDASEIHAAFPGAYVRADAVFAGGQGTVFRVERHDGTVGALKIYVPDPGAELEERTTREVDALQQIVRPTIVRLDNHGTATVRGEACRFVCTTFIEGVTLAARLQPNGTGLPLDEVARIGHDIADAIGGLWARPHRIVHRDIKPPNVMLATSGHAVLIDLGVARHTELDSLTVTGGTWGTQGYMSPEQALGRKALTCKSDVFTLGIMLQHCLTGRHPTNGSQRLLVTGPFARTQAIAPAVPIDVANLIDSMILTDANRRPMPETIKTALGAHARATGRPW
jgi:eukaryotic-like serine/threonine-protein kinase